MKRLPEFSLSAKLNPRTMVLTALVLTLLAVLAVRCGISEEEVLEQYLELREKININTTNKQWQRLDELLNKRVIANKKLLNKKVAIEIDNALSIYTKQENPLITMLSPIVLAEAKKLGGTQQLILEQAIYYELEDGSMGIRSAWTKPWPNEIVIIQPTSGFPVASP